MGLADHCQYKAVCHCAAALMTVTRQTSAERFELVCAWKVAVWLERALKQKLVSSPWLVIRLELEVMPEPEAAMTASAMT